MSLEVLVVDDEADIRELVSGVLEDEGYEVRSAPDSDTTLAAIDALQRHGMLVVGGLIVGNPDDDEASIEANLAFARRHVDWPYIQHPTP